MLKKTFFTVISIVLSLVLIIGLYLWDKKRYEISFPMKDIEYKKNIIKDSHNITYQLKNLKVLAGPSELEDFIKENDSKPQVYTPNPQNIKQGIFQANFHMHTRNSDGRANVMFLLDQAENYAKKYLNDKPMYIAITDHNTVLGAKEIIKILQQNPNRYNNIKVVAGIEMHSAFTTQYTDNFIEIHVLGLAINPYDKFLNKEFYKKNLKDKYNRKLPDRDFNQLISKVSNHGLVGIAHPARNIKSVENKKEDYIKELLQQYKSSNPNKICFIEGYYQSYDSRAINTKSFLDFINNEAEKLNIYRTGSTDTHGVSIFKN